MVEALVAPCADTAFRGGGDVRYTCAACGQYRNAPFGLEIARDVSLPSTVTLCYPVSYMCAGSTTTHLLVKKTPAPTLTLNFPASLFLRASRFAWLST